jgi:16S rRNA (cytosine1402-N4)-methyltransferase
VASSPSGQLLGLDLDPEALALARQSLADFDSRFTLVQASYAAIREQLALLGWEAVDGILLDLGVSSMQLDTPARGFSFREDGPLDMRFDPSATQSAADLVNDLSEEALADILFRYGEERRSRQVARAIVQARPLDSTLQLAAVVAKVIKKKRTSIHPATRTFQALRIAVNGELDALEEFLPQAVDALVVGGRLAIISFHSLEDRMVKQYFRQESRDCICPPEQAVCICGHQAVLKEINRRPIRSSVEEVQGNPRARSARLRVAEKL